MGKASELAQLNQERLELLWATFSSGSAFLPGTTAGVVYPAAKNAGMLYYKLSAEWFDVAQREMQNDDGGSEYDRLAQYIDKTVQQRAELQRLNIGPPLEEDAAMKAFSMEFMARLASITKTVGKVVDTAADLADKVGKAWPLLLLVALVIFLRRR
jgi:hypothetical protein